MHRLFPLLLLVPLAACPPDKGGTASDTAASSTGAGTQATDGDTGPATGDASTGAPLDHCAFLVGRTFSSDEMLECGLGPNGVELCNWKISFTATTYDHMLSDFDDSGTYTCDGGALVGKSGVDMTHAGTVDAGAGTLVWDDIAYTAVP